MLGDVLFTVLDTERLAGAFEGIRAIRQGKGQSPQIEEVASKEVSRIGLARRRPVRNQVGLVGAMPAGKPDERAFVVDVLDANAWSMWIRLRSPGPVAVGPEAE